MAERILREVQNTSLESEDGNKVSVTVSIGVITRRESESIDSMMQRADQAMYQAMYQAKENGRNRVCTDR